MKTKRTDIYVGLGSQCKDKKTETIDNNRNKLVEFFRTNKIDFSVTDILGGFVDEDGKYNGEDGVRISLIGDIKDEILKKIIDFLKKEYNQENVLVDIVDLDLKYM